MTSPSRFLSYLSLSNVTRNRQLVQIALALSIIMSVVSIVRPPYILVACVHCRQIIIYDTFCQAKLTSTNASDVSSGEALRQAAPCILLGVAACLVIQALLLVLAERRYPIGLTSLAPSYPRQNDYWNSTAVFAAAYRSYMVVAMTLLLLTREVFFVVTVADAPEVIVPVAAINARMLS